MRKTIIAAVAAIALAPITASMPVAHSAPACDVNSGNAVTGPLCQGCLSATPVANQSSACWGLPAAAPVQVPANVPNDSCAVLLQPPNASVGAYNGCETAKRARGGQ